MHQLSSKSMKNVPSLQQVQKILKINILSTFHLYDLYEYFVSTTKPYSLHVQWRTNNNLVPILWKLLFKNKLLN